MPRFSKTSLDRLQTCDQKLQLLALAVVQEFDCTVVCGHRSEEEQNLAYAEGNSKLKYPQSKHNQRPSIAMDLAPYIAGQGISWDKDQCYFFAGYVLATARTLGIPLRWGGDWDGDKDVKDQTFNDLVHFELIE